MAATQQPQHHQAALTNIARHCKRTYDLFDPTGVNASRVEDDGDRLFALNYKIQAYFDHVKALPPPQAQRSGAAAAKGAPKSKRTKITETADSDDRVVIEDADITQPSAGVSKVLATLDEKQRAAAASESKSSNALMEYKAPGSASSSSTALSILPGGAKPFTPTKPTWHAPWKLMKVVAGHLGWVRCVSVDPTNEWFVTGSADRTIKVWDLASCKLKLTLTGHISTVRSLVVSPRHPFLFSASEDRSVRCWDLETNKVIRHYHGHLSGVYTMAIHPTLDVIVTGGRDATVRVWDIRTKRQVQCFEGHTNTVFQVATQAPDPQIVSVSADGQVRLWDLAAGKCRSVLTNHKKGVRAVVIHPEEFSMATASADNIKKWKFPDGHFMENMTGHRAVINTLAMNQDGVMVSGADNGTLAFWDWKSSYKFQDAETIVQPGSLASEAGIFQAAFDMTGSRLITCEADKTIKIWKEDEDATPETHPIHWTKTVVKDKF